MTDEKVESVTETDDQTQNQEVSDAAMTISKKLINKGGHVLQLGEFLHMVGKVNSAGERIKLYKQYASRSSGDVNAIIMFVTAMWHEKAVMDLPEGAPPYNNTQFKDGYDFAPSNLQRELLKFPYFIKNTPKYINNQIKREKIFIGMLESVHPNDADMIIKIKDRKSIKNIRLADFYEAFPQYFPWAESLVNKK